ncbi:hypothetical protein PHPALM_30356 [Phytophthora palmivora]|uniref:ATP-binding cassette (ABC) Superfamily n=1 Tax=Phytophthora palmivora TaxID=4796 RepID=A0A2P4X5C2_9STRA|nr:hypothetical protein PHPALM_30356 [Phytophthora palmivora]
MAMQILIYPSGRTIKTTRSPAIKYGTLGVKMELNALVHAVDAISRITKLAVVLGSGNAIGEATVTPRTRTLSPEDRGGLFPVWGYSRAQPENTTTQSQTEDLFWRWVSLTNFTVQELKELREDRLLSYVLDQHDLRIEFAHLIAKRQLHSVMDGHRHQSKSAYDGRGLRAVNLERVFRLPRVLRRGATSPVHKQLALPRVPPLSDDLLHMEVELVVPIKEGRRSSHTPLSTRILLRLILLDPQLRVGTPWGPC